jgi:hypothetical protein
MFLAQIIWESGGLTQKIEQVCLHTKCPGSYTTGLYPSQHFYGRGYIQLVRLKSKNLNMLFILILNPILFSI